jgi:hypothetical protein
MTNVFSRLAPYGYIHHRALNSFPALARAEQHISSFPEKAQVLEGDLCWDVAEGRRVFYFRHPSYIVDTLPANEIARLRREKKLVTLEDMLERDSERKTYVIELKVGQGDAGTAISLLIEELQRRCRGRFWLDGFSLRLLQLAKSIDGSVTTSLHTELVTDQHVLLDAPEWPPLRVMKLADLKGVDAIAIRKRFSDAHMQRASAAVLRHGFTLVMSRLHTLGDYELSREWGAAAGYPKAAFEQIVQHDAARADRPAAARAPA